LGTIRGKRVVRGEGMLNKVSKKMVEKIEKENYLNKKGPGRDRINQRKELDGKF